MSIASEITRLQQAKNDLATSITNKGVTVPANTTLDGYAALVDSISAGDNQDYEDALVAFGVTEDLADSIEALTTYSNEVTGESDTTLSDAVRTLANGFGYGGAIYLYASKHINTDASFSTFNSFKDAIVPDLPLDKTFVLIEFVNNTKTTRSGIYWMQVIMPETGNVTSVGARVGAGFGGEYGCDVHAGATINIYVGEH